MTRPGPLCSLGVALAFLAGAQALDAGARRRPLLKTSAASLAAAAPFAATAVEEATSALQTTTFEPRGVTALDTVVFLIGIVPFAWAAVEFWRRIAVGEPFGTGSDSVVFDAAKDADEDQIRRFGGRRVLGRDAIITAQILMAAAAGSIGLAVLAAAQL